MKNYHYIGIVVERSVGGRTEQLTVPAGNYAEWSGCYSKIVYLPTTLGVQAY